jgi:hypothetical protein
MHSKKINWEGKNLVIIKIESLTHNLDFVIWKLQL